MRRANRGLSEQQSWNFLSQARSMELATTGDDGGPILRTLNGVVLGDWILFHGAVAGEKNQGIGRRAVVAATQTVCQVPSYFVDPERACPATTYFRSVQAHGTLLELTDELAKREAFEGLMRKLQPIGGYRSFLEPGELYNKELRAVRVIGVKVDSITGKANLGADRPTERTQQIVSNLWKRGDDGDVQAIEVILEASPLARPADFFFGRATLRVSPSEAALAQHAELLADEYWREGVSQARVLTSLQHSSAWIGAVDDQACLLGAARAVTDSAWTGRICDVVVRQDQRGKGLGRALLQLLLEHPALRRVYTLSLGTRNQAFYRAFGFQAVGVPNESGNTEMKRVNHAEGPTPA